LHTAFTLLKIEKYHLKETILMHKLLTQKQHILMLKKIS